MSPTEWNQKVIELAPIFGRFLQSWEWGEVQLSLGAPIKRLYRKIGEKEFLAQCVFQALPLGMSYWFVPGGPLGSGSVEDGVRFLKSELSQGAFLKLEPERPLVGGHKVHNRHPADSIIVALDCEEEKRLERMKAKTRYNIRLARKKGVTVEIAGLERFSDFWHLMQETAKRDGFSTHLPDRYRAILEKFQGEAAKAYLALAVYKGQVLAANLMIDFGGVTTYLHGASSNSEREVMAPYALQAELMERAYRLGIKYYDFWGVSPIGASQSDHWRGITRFKEGFGGERVNKPGTFDYPISRWRYFSYRALRFLRQHV